MNKEEKIRAMETQILITPITIYSLSDESVGILSASWTITEDIYIEKEDLEKFREELKAAWEFITDDAQIIFATDKHLFNESEGTTSIKESVLPISDVSGSFLCDGCNVREPYEHRCHGGNCNCYNPVCMEKQGRITHEELMVIVNKELSGGK